jgi:hypothetical protein
VVERAGARRVVREVIGTHRHGEMGSLTADGGSVTPIEPLSTDLPERVCTTLSGCSSVRLSARMHPCVHDGSERSEECLSILHIEVAIDPDHPEVRRRCMEPSPGVGDVLTSQIPFALRVGTPGTDDTMKLMHRVDLGSLDEQILGSRERRRIGASRLREHLGGRHRYVARLERLMRARHVAERPGRANALACLTPAHPLRRGKPSRRRQVPIPSVGPSALDLGQPPQTLDLECFDRPMELPEVVLHASVRKVGK